MRMEGRKITSRSSKTALYEDESRITLVPLVNYYRLLERYSEILYLLIYKNHFATK